MDAAGFVPIKYIDSWQWGEPPRQPYPDVVDEVCEIARGTDEPAIGGWIFDGDYAWIVGALPRGRLAFRFSINEEYDWSRAYAIREPSTQTTSRG